MGRLMILRAIHSAMPAALMMLATMQKSRMSSTVELPKALPITSVMGSFMASPRATSPSREGQTMSRKSHPYSTAKKMPMTAMPSAVSPSGGTGSRKMNMMASMMPRCRYDLGVFLLSAALMRCLRVGMCCAAWSLVDTESGWF